MKRQGPAHFGTLVAKVVWINLCEGEVLGILVPPLPLDLEIIKKKGMTSDIDHEQFMITKTKIIN